MSSSILITPSLGAAVVTSADTARKTRDEILLQAGVIKAVTDRIDADDATATLKRLRDFTKEIESQRVSAKAPALEISRKIDGLAKELTSSVEAEANRLSRLIGGFEAEERRKADEVRRKAEIEAARIKAEADQRAKSAMRTAASEEDGVRAVDKIIETSQQEIIQVRQTAVAQAAVRNAGTSVREDVCFEVTDIKALYAEHPELVTMEPNGSAIRAILRANPNIKITGLRHWREAKLNVR